MYDLKTAFFLFFWCVLYTFLSNTLSIVQICVQICNNFNTLFCRDFPKSLIFEKGVNVTYHINDAKNILYHRFCKWYCKESLEIALYVIFIYREILFVISGKYIKRKHYFGLLIIPTALLKTAAILGFFKIGVNA